jgi:hypothetical protein
MRKRLVSFVLMLLPALSQASAVYGPSPPAPHKVYPFPFAGRIYTDQYVYTTDRSLAQSSYSIWLDLDSKTEKGLGARFIGELDVFAKNMENPNQWSSFGQFREAYISYLGDGFDLRIGQQIIPWGKSDGVNPTDYFTAKNYTFLNPDDEVKRLGAPAVNLNFTPDAGTSSFSFQFVFQAFYPQTKLIIPDSVIPQGITVNRYARPPTAFQPDAMEGGVKIAFQKSNYDLSVSAFRGVVATPQFVYNQLTGTIDATNFEESAFGGDASFTVDDFVVRFETAVHLPDNGSANDPLFGLVEPNHWDSVVGVEKPIFTDFRVQFQFLYRYHLSYQDNVVVNTGNPILNQIMTGIAKANATLLNYQRQGNPGSSFRISYAKDSSRWTADLFIVGYFANGSDYLVRPQVGFTPVDNLKLLAGFDLYGGDPTTTLGSLHNRSDGFFEAKYIF